MNFGTTACSWDVVIPFEPLWSHYKRVIKDNRCIALFSSEPFSSYLRMSNIEWYKYDWIWNKLRPSNFQLCNFQSLKIHENINIFSNGNTSYTKNKNHMVYFPQKENLTKTRFVKKTNYGNRTTLRGNNDIKELGHRTYIGLYPKSIITYSNAKVKGRLHPTQKPVELLEYLIKTYTLEGETVLDNTMGSGSTGVACLNTNRKFIGIEKDDNYFKIAKNRIEENSLRIF